MPQSLDLTADELDISIKKGGALDIIITYGDPRNPTDVTGWDVRSDWKKLKSDASALVAVNGTVYNGAAGEFRYYYSDSDILALLAANTGLQSVYYDFWVKPPSGDWIPIAEGQIHFNSSITTFS